MNINKIQKAKYNPRKMNKEAREGLSSSIETFKDISGIVINKRTGTVLAGNHRWDLLCSQYGENNLLLNFLHGEYYSLDTKDDEHTGFVIRILPIYISKEKAANVAANSSLLQGEFTEGLQMVLSEIDDFDDDLFDDLRLSEMMIDLDDLGTDDDEWFDDDPKNEIVEEESNKKVNKLERKQKEVEDVPETKIILETIKIRVTGEVREEFLAEIKEIIDSSDFYKENVEIL